MLIMLVVMIRGDQPLVMHLAWVLELLLGAAKDNQQCHSQQQRLSIMQQQWRLKKVHGWYSCWRIYTKLLIIQYHYTVIISQLFV